MWSGIRFGVNFWYKIGMCSYYLEKIRINESQKKVFLWHSERDSCGKGGLRMTEEEYIKERKSKCHREQESQHIQITLQQQIECLNVLTVLKDEGHKRGWKAGLQCGYQVAWFCPQVSIVLCRYDILSLLRNKKFGNYVLILQWLSKDFLHIQTFQQPLKVCSNPWSLLLLWGRLPFWRMVYDILFRKRKYYSSMIEAPK